MNADQKRQKRKLHREQIKARKLQKDQVLEEDDDLDVLDTLEESPDVESDADNEETQKDMFSSDIYYPGSPDVTPAPTTFDELDQARVVAEQAQAVENVTWDTRTLVQNILRNPTLDPVEKAEAIKTVADEFATRVVTETEDMAKDLDLLELDAIIAHDRRTTSAAEFFGDFIKKAVVSTASRNDMPDSNFALVVTRGGKKIRKYLIHDKSHVRAALSRAAQMIKRGGEAASDARAALPKIHAAAKKFGIGSDISKDRNAILVEKDASNQWRWVGWVSNNYIDWDGEIISEDAHKEYVDWWEKNKDVSPVFVSWHTPGTAREAPVDFMMYENGFLIASGILTDQEAAGLLKAQASEELGMSHGTYVFSRDAKDPRIITKYRMYEISDLPLTNAANPFTDFETLVKEVGMDKLEYLTKIMGSEEKAKAFLEKTGMKKEALDAAGIESKEKKPEPEAKKPVEPIVKADAPAPAPAPVPAVDDIVAQVMKQMDIPGLNEFVQAAQAALDKVPVLEELVKSLQTGEDEKLAEKLTPPAARFAWSKENRASQSADTEIKSKEDAKLKKSVPGVPDGYWISEATQTAPIKIEESK
jgi:hypothetical protein